MSAMNPGDGVSLLHCCRATPVSVRLVTGHGQPPPAKMAWSTSAMASLKAVWDKTSETGDNPYQ